MIRFSIVIAIALSALFAPAFALDGSYSILTSTSTGLRVGMNLYVPPGYDLPHNAGKHYPLMVFLGGAGERGDPTNADVVLLKSTVWGPAKEIRDAGRDFPFIVVTPISTEFYSSLPAEYNTMVEYLKSTTRVDSNRIYFTGACAGASGVMEFAQVHPELVAAIVPGVTEASIPRSPERLQQIPTWLFHGFADPAVNRQQTIIWADAIASSFGTSPVSCMNNYPYGSASDGTQTYNPDNQTGSFRPGSGWTWRKYTLPSDDSLLLFTMMSTDLHNVWHYAVTNNTVLHWMSRQRRQSSFAGTAPALPGRIQAEAFDFGGPMRAYHDTTIANTGSSPMHETMNPYDGTVDGEQVDLVTRGDNTLLTDTVAGEWVEYTVNASSGTYRLKLRLSSATVGSLRLLNADGSVLAGPITVPTTTDFVTIEVPEIHLLPGIQTLRLAIDQGGFELDWFDIENLSGAADVIVDNRQTDKVTIVGPWVSTSYTSGFYNVDYLSVPPGTTASAAFRPTLPRSSSYQVFVQYPSTPSYGVARVTVDAGDGHPVSIALVDQRVGGGSWQSLGVFRCSAGTFATVTIAAEASPGYISADAVRFWEIDPSNTVPNVVLTAPDDHSSVTSGVILALTATASDPDIHSTTPGLQKVEFYANDGSTNALIGVSTNGTGDPATYNVNHALMNPGDYILTAVAYDYSGGDAISPSRSITVSAPPAGVLSFNTGHFSVNEGDGSATISIQRDGGSAGTISVDYATVAGSASAADYIHTNGTLTWADGDMSVKSFTIAILQDDAVEGDENLTLSLSRPTNGANIGGESTLTIADDDAPSDGVLQFSAVNYYAIESNAGSSTVTITVICSGSLGSSRVTWTSSDGTATGGSDYVAGTGTLTFLPGETTKSFTITIFGDTTPELDETISLTLSSPTDGAVLGTQATASVVILDDESSGSGPRPTQTSSSHNSDGCGNGSSLGLLLVITLTVASLWLWMRSLS